MSMQRATCPHCGKFSIDMYHSEESKKRTLVHCDHCGKPYFVSCENGRVKTEKRR